MIYDFLLGSMELSRNYIRASLLEYNELIILTVTFFIREANPNVLSDSLTAEGEEFNVQMTEMRASPERDGWSIRVSFEFRKGT